ncbi:MAG: zf-HC2 domain-containing protein [Candidatus Atribacteria bacterium]|nr:zf-HC2 domain-containing protein [Candidatus Atribacteria bacterium]
MNCKKIKKLLQLYIDNTLTFGEKQIVEKHLEKCSECRAELKSLSATVRLIKSLPEVSTSPDFTENLMLKISQIEEKERERIIPAWQISLKNLWSTPRYRYSLVSILTVAVFCVFTVVFLFHPSLLPWQGETLAQVEVTFTISGIEAQSIAVAGDFNGWSISANKLEDLEGDGIWTGKMYLKPGRYEYMLVVDDGKWVTDPNAKVYADDGFGSKNAVLYINDNSG